VDYFISFAETDALPTGHVGPPGHQQRGDHHGDGTVSRIVTLVGHSCFRRHSRGSGNPGRRGYSSCPGPASTLAGGFVGTVNVTGTLTRRAAGGTGRHGHQR
jgi:hypothetical protein